MTIKIHPTSIRKLFPKYMIIADLDLHYFLILIISVFTSERNYFRRMCWCNNDSKVKATLNEKNVNWWKIQK